MPAVNVTPSLLLGRPPTRVPVRGAATVDAAVQIIRGGGRALVGNATLAQDVLVALGLDADSARTRVVDTLRLGDEPDEEELSIKAAVVHDGDGDGMIYDGTPWERPAPLQRDAFEVVRMKPIADFAPHVGRPWYGVEDWGDVRVDLPKHFRTADAYKALPEFDDSPETRAAYDALIAEVNDQYRLLTEELGYTVEVVSEDPYPDVKALHADLAENKRIKVLATASTPPGHAYMTDEENDRFRAVHDAFGHAGTGRGFDRHGEEAAYQAHANMFSPLARFALATETRGQNAVLIQSVELTGEGVFPPQKLALLPEEFTKAAALDPTDDFADPDIDNATHLDGIHHRTGGRWQHDASELELAHWVARREAARRGVQEVKAGTRTLYHLTDDPDFELDPTFAPERNTTMGGQMKPGIFLSPTPESWVNSYNYWRPYVVEVEVPEGVGETGGGYGGEVYVLADDFDKVKVGRVIPLDGYARETYGEYGWVEDDTGIDTFTGEPIPDKHYGTYPFRDGWRSPDARDMDPAWRSEWENQVAHHLYRALGESWTGTEPGILYHGTDDEANVESILNEGIRPGGYLASDTRPVVNRIGSSDGMIFAIAVDDDLHLEPVEDYERVFTAPDGVPAENIVGARWYSYGPPTPPVRIEVGDRTVTAFDGEREVGRLEFDPDGFVAGVGVDEDWQRQGVATAMYAAMPMAPVLPDTGPDSGNTDAGDAWVEAVATGRASRVATKHVARRGEPVESTVLGKGWAGELDPDYRLPSKAITRRKKKNRLPRDADNDGKIYEGTPMERWKALVLDEVKALPRDGDGDGIIYEGTLMERPASPVRAKLPDLSDAFAARTGSYSIPGGAEGDITIHTGPQGSVLQKTFMDQTGPRREVWASGIAERIGVPAPRVVPDPIDRKSVYMDFFTDEEGRPAQTLGEFAGDTYPSLDDPGVARLVQSEAGRRIALLDFVIGNKDRNSGNIVIVDDQPVAIDHAIALESSFGGKDELYGGLFVKNWVQYRVEMGTDKYGDYRITRPEILGHPWSAEELDEAEAAVRDVLPNPDEVGSPGYGALRRIERLRAALPTDETKAAPRDGDNDGMIDDGTPFERPAPLKAPRISHRAAVRSLPVSSGPKLETSFTENGMLEQALPKASLYDIVEAADKEGPRLPQGAQADVSIKKGPLGSVVIKDFYDEDDENLWHELWAADIARLFDVPSPRVIPYGNTAVAMDLVTTADGTPAPTLMEWVDNEVANRRASEDEPDEPGIVEFFTDRGVNLYDRAADPEAHDEATREYEAILKRPITAVWAEVANTPEGKRIALFDWVTGNVDRHDENVLVVDGKPVAIDHSQILVDNGETISSGGFGHIRGMLTDYWIKTEDPKEDWSQGRVLSHPWTREELDEARGHLSEVESWIDSVRPPLSEIRKMRERIDMLEAALPARPFSEIEAAIPEENWTGPEWLGSQGSIDMGVGPLGGVVRKVYDGDEENAYWADLNAFKVAEALGVPTPRMEKLDARDLSLRMDLVPESADEPARPAPTLLQYDPSKFAELVNSPEMSKIALLDFIVGNSDRNFSNLLVSDGKLVAIDHGYAFSGLYEGAGPADDIASIENVLDADMGDFWQKRSTEIYTPWFYEDEGVWHHNFTGQQLADARIALNAIDSSDIGDAEYQYAMYHLALLEEDLRRTDAALIPDDDPHFD